MDWFHVTFLLTSLQGITGFSTLIKDTYALPEATNNVDSFLNDGQITYIGGENYFLVVRRDINTTVKVDFRPSQADENNCRNRRDTPYCFNSIKLIDKMSSTVLLVCGTNAYTPACAHFDLAANYSRSLVDIDQITWINTNPSNKLAHVLQGQDANTQLYVAHCNGQCGLRRRISNNLDSLQAWFKGPTFLDAFASDQRSDRLYFFLRENENIFQFDGFTANPGAQTNSYGMVATVCKADRGGPNRKDVWMTFMKARLLCPYPGGAAFSGSKSNYYDYLRYTYKVGNIVYAVFSFPSHWDNKETALCAYDLSAIDTYMDGTVFPNNDTQYFDPTLSPALMKTFPKTGNTKFLPGQCIGPTQSTMTVSSNYENFIQSTTLIKRGVTPIGGKPLLVDQDLTYDFVVGMEVNSRHIVFLLKADGTLKKLLDPTDGSMATELWNTKLEVPSPILSASMAEQDLILVTRASVLNIATANCSTYTSCNLCSLDPQCSWRGGKQFGCADAAPGDIPFTTCESPANAPSEVNVSNSEPWNVSWERPTGSGNVKVTGYVYEVRRASDNYLVSSDLSTVTNVQVPNLQRGVTYTVKVWSMNGKTPSSSPASTKFTTELQAPTMHAPEVTSSEATVGWRPVVGARSYNVSIYRSSENSQVQSYVISFGKEDTDLYFRIHGLAENTEYTARVFAISPEGAYSLTNQSDFSTSAAAITNSIVKNNDPTVPLVFKSTTITTTTATSPDTGLVAGSIAAAVSTKTNNKNVPSVPVTVTTATKPPSDIGLIITSVETGKVATSNNAQGQQQLQIFEGGSSVGFVVVIVVLLIILILLCGILLQNRLAFGVKTKEIRTGDDKQAMLKRKYAFMWLRNFNNEPGGNFHV